MIKLKQALKFQCLFWELTGSNRRPSACKKKNNLT